MRHETLMGRLSPGKQGRAWKQEEIEGALKEIESELRDYARDHPNLSDQELQRHAYASLTNHLGREWISISSGGAGEIDIVFDKDR